MHAYARGIVDAVRHPLVVLDLKLRVVVANPAFYRKFGSMPSSTEGHDFTEIDGGRWNYGQLRGMLLSIIPGNSLISGYEVEYFLSDLSRRVTLVDAHQISRDEDGAAMILVSFEDVTAQRQTVDDLQKINDGLELRMASRTAELDMANRELLEANHELAAANRELEAFCFSVSHDLRAPLRALDGFSEELLNSYANRLDEQGRHYLKRIRAGTQRMGHLIDDLLKLSKVTRAEMRREAVNLTALAHVVIEELRELDPARNVTFTALPDLVAMCDPPLIRVVIENLLGNAWKFTSNQPAAMITFGANEIAGKLTFVIRDNGAGFDMAFRAKLFHPFQRLHSDREFSGTGIGLATVERIIRRHGGKVWAEGVVGQGAAIFFTIPG